MGIEVDSGGYTQSPDCPVQNAYLSTPTGSADPFGGYPPTAFVTKFSADGQSLVYSTFLGGSVEDGGVAIAVDAAGSAYVLQTAMAAALTPGDAALYQIAVTVPSTLAPGDYPIGLQVDGDVGSTGLLTVAGH